MMSALSKMNETLYQRAMSEDEQALLQKLLTDAPPRWKSGLGNAIVLWATSSLIVVLGWSAVAWLGRVVFELELGWKTSVGQWVMVAGASACAGYAIYSTIRWLRSSRDYRPLARLDLAGGTVFEERLTLVDARPFQEPEHGGLIYFLRTKDDRVFVLFDHESQDLGVAGKDPLSSSFRPKSELLIVRAPHTRLVISKTFAGHELAAPPIRKLGASPREWPETDEFCSVPWSDLEGRYASAA
jgi:hypothetical protein